MKRAYAAVLAGIWTVLLCPQATAQDEGYKSAVEFTLVSFETGWCDEAIFLDGIIANKEFDRLPQETQVRLLSAQGQCAVRAGNSLTACSLTAKFSMSAGRPLKSGQT